MLTTISIGCFYVMFIQGVYFLDDTYVGHYIGYIDVNMYVFYLRFECFEYMWIYCPDPYLLEFYWGFI